MGKTKEPKTSNEHAENAAVIDPLVRLAMELAHSEVLPHLPPSWIADIEGRTRVALALVLAAKSEETSAGLKGNDGLKWGNPAYHKYLNFNQMTYWLLKGAKGVTAQDLERLIDWCRTPKHQLYQHGGAEVIVAAADKIGPDGLTEKIQAWMRQCVEESSSEETQNLNLLAKIRKLSGESGTLVPDTEEPLTDHIRAFLGKLKGEESRKWNAVMQCVLSCSGSSPTAKWLKGAADAARSLGPSVMQAEVTQWLMLAEQPRPVGRFSHPAAGVEYVFTYFTSDLLRGVCWMLSLCSNANAARALSRMAVSAYRKVPGLGPRAVKVGNAAVGALGNMPGREALGQLAMLSVKVKFGTAQRLIDKALAAAAERENLPLQEIAELAVPAYGMTEVGRRVEELAGHRVEIVIHEGAPELRVFKPDGKEIKSVPAKIKQECAEDLKELKGVMKDIAAMLPAQRNRIDQLFTQDKVWPLAVWRERYLDHPLVGVIARRLIWNIEDGRKGGAARAVCWLESAGGLVDVDGTKIGPVAEDAVVRLWHPLGEKVETVRAWRAFFEERRIKQPFKQAHREVYLLTDAERRTNVYSNRYAAHVLKQHQFNALCALRGWKVRLRLMVDGDFPPPSRELPAFGLRAEYWVEGAGDEYGTDTNESGAYNLVTTDQVRFYRIGAPQARAHAFGGGYGIERGPGGQTPTEAMPLSEVPAIVLSEILRDVDLFVGVTSVANNPNWQDGGPNEIHRAYWWDYGFAELSGTGQSRKEFLERLLPRLEIAEQTKIVDRFLHVRGKIRPYKIHLGSGNILMEPNDEYLCIVPNSRQESANDMFLPFEGDRVLSIILSKAFMLADDDQITDPTITSQIRRGRH